MFVACVEKLHQLPSKALKGAEPWELAYLIAYAQDESERNLKLQRQMEKRR